MTAHSSRRTAAAQHGANPRRQLLKLERLGDVVIAADAEPGELVFTGIFRGQKDHRNLRTV